MRAESVCKGWQRLIKTSLDLKTTLLIEDHMRYRDSKSFDIKNSKQLSVVRLTQFQKQLNKSSNYKIIISKIITRFSNLKLLYLCLVNVSLREMS
jgi:hypothetical protein